MDRVYENIMKKPYFSEFQEKEKELLQQFLIQEQPEPDSQNPQKSVPN